MYQSQHRKETFKMSLCVFVHPEDGHRTKWVDIFESFWAHLKKYIKNYFLYKYIYRMGRPRMIGPRTLAYTKALERKAAAKKAPVAKLTRRVGTLSKQVNGDINWVDINAVAAAVDYNGSIIGLSDLSQGQGVGFRDGTTQVLRNMNMHVSVFGIATATPGVYYPSTVRVIIYLDKENTIPSAATLLTNTGSANSVISTFQQLNRHKFLILYDQVRYLGANDPEKIFKIKNINLRGRQSKYTSTTAASVNGNVVKMCIISDNAPGATTPNRAYNGRVFFHS